MISEWAVDPGPHAGTLCAACRSGEIDGGHEQIAARVEHEGDQRVAACHREPHYRRAAPDTVTHCESHYCKLQQT